MQKQRRDEQGYVKVTVVLMLDSGWPVGRVAEALGLDEATLYHYVRAFTDLGLEKYLAHERPGYWDLLSSAQLGRLCQQVNATLYTDVKAIQDWVARTCRVRYSLFGLSELLHRLGFTYKLTTPVPCQADTEAQEDFLQELAVLEAHARSPCRTGPGGTLLRRCGPPDPQHALHPCRVCRGRRTAAAHRQRPGAGESERGPQRLRTNPNPAR